MSANQSDGGNSIFELLYRTWDIILLSVLFVACSVPLITFGASVTALHESVMEVIENKEQYAAGNFLRHFRDDFKASTLVWILCAALIFISGAFTWFAAAQNSKNGNTLTVIIMAVGVVLVCLAVMMCMYVFPIQARFKTKIGIQIKTAFICSIKNFLTTVILALLIAVMALLFYFKTIPALVGFSVFGFGIGAFIYDYFMLRCFAPYLEPLFTEEELNADRVLEKASGHKAHKDIFLEDALEQEMIQENTETKETKNDTSEDKTKITKSDTLEDKAQDNKEIMDSVSGKKKSIQLTDALEDEKARIEAERRAREEEILKAVYEADKMAQEMVKELANRVEDEVYYETSGQNVYRRTTSNELIGKSGKRGNNKAKVNKKRFP